MRTHRAFTFLRVLVATKFVTQILEPTGGRIEKPKGWFYAERHQSDHRRTLMPCAETL